MTTRARVVRDDAPGRAAAIEVLRAGGVVALPTDTVYGIAVALQTPGGIERLFMAKRRPPDKGIMLLLDDAAQADEIGVVDLVLDDGPAHGGPSSTVVDCTGERPVVVRVGAVPLERVSKILEAAGVAHDLR